MCAPYVFDGPINGRCFQAWGEQLLVPTLRPGDLVILDNLGSHKGRAVRQAIRSADADLWFLPAYSPDFNAIEQAFAKIKHWMRDAQKRSVEDTWRHLGRPPSSRASDLRFTVFSKARGEFHHWWALLTGILPGIVGILFYVGAVQFMIRLKPELGPPGERTAWPARWRALRDVWGVVVLFVVVIGGIYVGAFTPTEAAGIGAFGALLFTLFKKVLDRRMLFRVLAETGVTTSMLFVVLIGALIFANFINETGMPNQLAEFVRSLEIAPLFVIFGIMAIYIVCIRRRPQG